MSKNCKQLTNRLYFSLDEMLHLIISEASLSNTDIMRIFSDKIKKELNLTVSEDELKLFIKNSTIDPNVITGLLTTAVSTQGDLKTDDDKTKSSREDLDKDKDAEGEAKDQSKDLIVDLNSNPEIDEIKITSSLNKVVYLSNTSSKPIRSQNDLYTTYFPGGLSAYNLFVNDFSYKIFTASYVSFKKGIVVETQKQLNDNIMGLRDEYLKDIIDYLNSVGVDTTGISDLSVLESEMKRIFEEGSVSNHDLIKAVHSQEDSSMLKAYNALVALKHFDDLISMFSINVKFKQDLSGTFSNEISDKYSVVTKHKQKNNFSDSYVNILDEMTSLTRNLISYIPLVGYNGKEKHGKYLTPASVSILSGKLRNAQKKLLGKDDFRFNPQLRIRELLIKILSNKSDALIHGLNEHDLDVANTLFNYFYKSNEDHENNIIKTKLLPKENVTSLLQIKKNSLNGKNFVNSNIVVNVMTSLLDKTISQKYVSIQETFDGARRIYTQMETLNNYYRKTTSVLNESSNKKSFDLTSFTVENKVNNKKVSFEVNGITYNTISLDKNLSKVNVNMYKDLTREEWAKYLSGNHEGLSTEQINYASFVKFANDLLGLNLLSNDAELLTLMQVNTKEVMENLLSMVGDSVHANKVNSIYNTYVSNVTKGKEPNSLNEYIKTFKTASNEQMYPRGYVVKGRLAPFNSSDRYKNFINQYSEAKAIINNDASKAISRNRSGDGIPNSTLHNLIGDDATSFNKLRNSKENDAGRKNLFGHSYNNGNLIVDTIYRTDIEMQDGTTKNIKKFNGAEIATQGIFHDFLLSYANDFVNKDSVQRIMLEPTVFADKSGQPMKVYNMNHEIEYSYTNENGTITTIKNTIPGLFREGKLRTTHYYTMREQYKSMHDKLINDYRKIFNYAQTANVNLRIPENLQGVSFNDYSIIDFDSLLKINKLNLYKLGNAVGVEVQSEFHVTNGGVNGLLLKNFKQYQVGIFQDKSLDPQFKKTGKTYFERRLQREDKKFVFAMEDAGVTMDVYDYKGEITNDFSKILNLYVGAILGKDHTSMVNDSLKEEFIKEWINKDGTMKLYKVTKGYKLDEESIYNPDVEIELNPLISLFHQSHQFLNSNYVLGTVGGAHAHVIKTKKGNELNPFTKTITLTDVDGNEFEVENPTYAKNKQSYITKYLTPDEIWEEIEESARTIAMHKRMVAYQAKLHPFTQNLIEGTSYHMNMAVVSDLSKAVWNTVGDSDNFKVADGSGYIPMSAAILMRNSLGDFGSDTVTFKAIRHDLDSDTEVAHLDKYAIQAASNERMRTSEGSPTPYSIMNKLFLSTISFNDVLPNSKIGNFNLFDRSNYYSSNPLIVKSSEITDYSFDNLTNLENNRLEFLQDAKLYEDVPGLNIYGETIGMGYNPTTQKYVIVKRFKNYDGTLAMSPETNYQFVQNPKNDADGVYVTEIDINNMWDLWQNVLGGMNSISESEDGPFKIGNKNYKYSDASHEYLVQFINNLAFKKDDNLYKELSERNINVTKPNNTNSIDQDNYYQPLKAALIWQINNTTGMKNGAKSINSYAVLTNPPTQDSEKLMYFNTTSINYGVQGNFDHIIDEEHEARVRESSQMISLAASNGFSRQKIDFLYKSIARVVKNAMSEELKALTQGNDAVILMLTKTLLKTLDTKERLGLAQDYGINVKRELDKLISKNPELSHMKDAKFQMAFSDPNFYSAMVSMISGSINSSAIRRDLPGIGAVLSQCYNHVTTMNVDGVYYTPDMLINKKKKELFDQYVSKGDYDSYTNELNEFIHGLRNRTIETPDYVRPIKPENINSFDILKINGKVFELNSARDYYNLKNKRILPNGDPLKDDDVLELYVGPQNLKSSYFEFNEVVNGIPTDNVFNEMDLLGSKLAWAYSEVMDLTGDLSNLNKLLAANPNSTQLQALIQAEIQSILVEAEKIPNIELLKTLLVQNNPKSEVKNPLENLLTKLNTAEILKTQIIKQQQNELLLLENNGIFTYDYNTSLSGEIKSSPGEIIIPMYNRDKFGIEAGINISDINIEYFIKKFNKVLEANSAIDYDFYLSSRNGKHVYFVKDVAQTSSLLYAIDPKNIKNKDGKKYLTNASGEIMFEINDNMEVFTDDAKGNISGTIVVTYKNEDDIKLANDSQYFVSVEYGNNTEMISNYINKYDLKSTKYFDDKGNFNKTLYVNDADNRLRRIAHRINQSWQEQLKIIGTRIPAQALQSVMAMKIVGFTEGGLNTAYVPIKKNYLDGSDFDIDKIYLSGRSVGKNGKYMVATQFYNYGNMVESAYLPFPDGKTKTYNPNKESKLTQEDYNLLNTYRNAVINDIEESPEILQIFPQVVKLLNTIAEESDINFENKINDENDPVLNFINHYFTNDIKDQHTVNEAAKNVVISTLHDVVGSVVNSMSANRGVDMNDPQAGAKKSPKTWASKQFSGDNYATLPLMKEENGAGKDVIGISAVAMKTFYALTQFTNTRLSVLNDEFAEDTSQFEQDYNQMSDNAKRAIDLTKYFSPEEISLLKQKFKKNFKFNTYQLYNEETLEKKAIVTTLLANANISEFPLMEAVYFKLLEESAPPQVEIVDKFTKDSVSADSNNIYLFGDNTHDRLVTKHVPISTQAVIRGLPNAVGIDTKKDRGTNESGTSNKIAFKIPMNFEDGTNGNRMKPEFKNKSTIQLIQEGHRTATTRDMDKKYNQYDLKEGDIVEFYASQGRSKGEKVLVKITKLPYSTKDITPDEWSKLEGWDASVYEKNKEGNYSQYQFRTLTADEIREVNDAKSSYFTDADFDQFKSNVDSQLAHAIALAKKTGGKIIIPKNGIGTGKAQLKKRAPECFKYLTEQLDNLKILGGIPIETMDVTKMSDRSLTLSAMVSAATDNAKELILAKINAGPELAGTYSYLIMQGVDFNDITDFMVSPTIDAIVKKSKSNVFKKNNKTIKTSISYFLEGIKIREFLGPKELDTLRFYLEGGLSKINPNPEFKLTDPLKYNDNTLLLEHRKKIYNGTATIADWMLHLLPVNEMYEFIDVNKKGDQYVVNPAFKIDKILTILSNKYPIDLIYSLFTDIIPYDSKKGFSNSYMKYENNDSFIPDLFTLSNEDFYGKEETVNLNLLLEKYFTELKSRKNLIDKSNFNKEKAKEFEKIFLEAEEVKIMGARLGVNGGIGTNLHSQYSFNHQLASFFYERLHQYEENNKVLFSSKVLPLLENALDLISEFDTPVYGNPMMIVTNPEYFHKTIYDGDPTKLNALREYQQIIIELYDIVKSKFNIFDLELNSPHFKAMMEAQVNSIKVFDSVTKYKYTRFLMKELQDSGYIPFTKSGNYSKYNDKQVKTIESFITSDLVNLFFDSNQMTITIPTNTKYYDSKFELQTSTSNKVLHLNTPEGRASFKLYFEEYLINKWKKNANFVGNRFIENLTEDQKLDPITGRSYKFLKLDIDMLNIKSNSDKLAFQEYLNGFSDLKHHSELGVPISDLFVIYNLLINNNTFGKDSFTKIFSEMTSDQNANEKSLIRDYLKFIGDVDASISNPTGSDYMVTTKTLDKVALMLAPIVNKSDMYRDLGQYIKVYNPQSQMYDIYTRTSVIPNVNYKKYSEFTLVSDIPANLYIGNSKLNPNSKNNLAKLQTYSDIVKAYKNGNINILINCD